MDEAGLLELWEHVIKLKGMRRTGWELRGVREPETVGSHSFGTALLAYILAKERGLDPSRAAMMGLVHDLPESIVGDVVPGDPAYSEKLAEEKRAAPHVFEGLGEIHSLWTEYIGGESEIARTVLEADKLDMLLQARHYRDGGENVDDFFEPEYKFSGLAARLLDKLRD